MDRLELAEEDPRLSAQGRGALGSGARVPIAPAGGPSGSLVGFMTHEEIVQARLTEISAHTAQLVEFAALTALGVGVLVGFTLFRIWADATRRRNIV